MISTSTKSAARGEAAGARNALRLEAGPPVERDGARVVAGDFQQDLAQAQRGGLAEHQAQGLGGEAVSPAILLADHHPEVGGATAAVDAREVGEADQPSGLLQLDRERETAGVGALGDRAQPALGLARPERCVAPERAAPELVVPPPGDDPRQVGATEGPQPYLLAGGGAPARDAHGRKNRSPGRSSSPAWARMSRARPGFRPTEHVGDGRRESVVDATIGRPGASCRP